MNASELDQLVGRVQAGDRDAFGALVFEIRRELRIFLSAHAPSIDVVEEVLQATLVTCYESIGRYERRGTFLSWVKGIARHRLLKELHERQRWVATEGDELDRIVLRAALDGAERDEGLHQELVERLDGCMEKLSEGSRELIRLRYFERMAVKDIARRLNRTETWAAVTLFRIREDLRECMAGGGGT